MRDKIEKIGRRRVSFYEKWQYFSNGRRSQKRGRVEQRLNDAERRFFMENDNISPMEEDVKR